MIKIIQEKCTGCGICADVCPQGVISFDGNTSTITDAGGCMECGACDKNCLFGAIELTKGTGCLAAIVKEDILKITPKGTGCGCSSGKSGGCC